MRPPIAKRLLDALQANLERLELLDDILDVVLDSDLDDSEVGGAVRALGPKRLANAVRSEAERPPRDHRPAVSHKARPGEYPGRELRSRPSRKQTSG